MAVNSFDTWTVATSESTPLSIAKLNELIDLSSPPDLFLFACQAWTERNESDSGAWKLLLDSQVVLRSVSHPTLLTIEQAMTLTRYALETDPMFDTKLLRRLIAHRLWPHEVPSNEVMRTLELVEQLDSARRLSMTLVKFAKFPDRWVQSKVAKILGRCVDSVEVLEELFENRDGRVRANLIEGIGRRKSIEPFISLIERAARDQHTRVSSIALAIRAREGHGGAGALMKMRLNSKMDHVREPAEFAQRIASALAAGQEPVEEAPGGTEGDEAEPAGELLNLAGAVSVVDSQPAVTAPVEEVHR